MCANTDLFYRRFSALDDFADTALHVSQSLLSSDSVCAEIIRGDLQNKLS